MEALAGEIRRVAILRERFRQMQGALDSHEIACRKPLSGTFAPVLGVIDTSLDRAVAAAGTGDASLVIASLVELRTFLPTEG
jgi:hypothetical protein